MEVLVSDEFDWKSDRVVIPTVPGIAVYTNPDGDVVIRQFDAYANDGDSFVYFPKWAAKAIVAAIRRESKPNAD